MNNEVLNPQQEIENQSAIASVGSVAVEGTLPPQLHDIEFGDITYQTDLPEGLDIFNDDAQPRRPLSETVKVDSLDSLPVGDFSITGTMTIDNEDGPVSRDISRVISVNETDNGKVINQEALGGDWIVGEHAEKLMEAVGYEIGDDGEMKVPAPETVKTAAAKVGVDVEFFPDDFYIKGPDYLGAFKDKKYPISLLQYKHDIEDDHITAMVLGGDPLKIALSDAASQALDQDEATQDRVSRGIDSFTAVLRGVVSPTSIQLGEAYGNEKGRQTLRKEGLQIGIPPEVTDEILATALQNGHAYGLEVRGLK